MNTYPLLLTPPVKDYIWGGTRLKEEFGYRTDAAIAAEAWVLSCHKDGSSVVANGPMAGQTLPDVLDTWGKEAIGEKAAAFPYFPVLIKLIDAHDRLSVQVHPNDEYAMRVEGEFGKTEMWYVVDCEPGAQLIYGFKTGLTKEEFRARIEDNTLMEVCNFVPVKKGDVFFIEAGTLHAIGAGILIAEVQQNSNTTYRVSDYGRLGADGKPRPLHVDKAVDVTVTTPPTVPYGAIGEVSAVAGGKIRKLASCDLFTAEAVALDGAMQFGSPESFTSVLVLDGTAEMEWNGEKTPVKKGDSLFVPAGVTVRLDGSADLLCSRV
ncbi:MAG: type I phosphomannose isomerase catalytic subunit [Acutalibacteraceae bacterium]|jgi:mannose-6-phosphate isomerase